MKKYLEKLLRGNNLTKDEIEIITNTCINENANDSQIAAFLTGLRVKGETAEEIAGIAEVIQEQSMINQVPLQNIMDNCGTGGDRSNSFNISTTAAFVLAGAGIPVAKHGNRSISSTTGSADVLEHLGVSLTMSTEKIRHTLLENKIVFLYAPHIHSKLKPFMKVRKDLGLPTIFNLIGPLTNPIPLQTQLMGVYDQTKLHTIAKALHTLGRKRAVVINGADNMDEGSLAGDNDLVLLNNGEIQSFTIHPNDIGLPVYTKDDIKGGDAKENADILLSVLNNVQSPYLDTVLFNAALGFFANGKANTVEIGIEMAKESIASGKAKACLQYLIDISRQDSTFII